MTRYIVKVRTTATIEETWQIDADKKPSPEEALEMIEMAEFFNDSSISFVSEKTLGDEEDRQVLNVYEGEGCDGAEAEMREPVEAAAKCIGCGGTGHGKFTDPCAVCHGSGVMRSFVSCLSCHGEGRKRYSSVPCEDCAGWGEVNGPDGNT